MHDIQNLIENKSQINKIAIEYCLSLPNKDEKSAWPLNIFDIRVSVIVLQ